MRPLFMYIRPRLELRLLIGLSLHAVYRENKHGNGNLQQKQIEIRAMIALESVVAYSICVWRLTTRSAADC